jgi:predicted enzyme related to lactoylglutathione lyase
MGNNTTEISIVTKPDMFSEVLSFYKNILGEPDSEGERKAMFRIGTLEFYIHQGDADPPSFRDHFGFGMEDLDAACQDVKSRGIVLDAEPKEYYWGKSAYLTDPEGRELELMQEQEGT